MEAFNIRHSGLDPESRVSVWIPAFAGMTTLIYANIYATCWLSQSQKLFFLCVLRALCGESIVFPAAGPLRLKHLDQDQARDEPPDMGEKRHPGFEPRSDAEQLH